MFHCVLTTRSQISSHRGVFDPLYLPRLCFSLPGLTVYVSISSPCTPFQKVLLPFPFSVLTFEMTHSDSTLPHMLLLRCFPYSTGLIKAIFPFQWVPEPKTQSIAFYTSVPKTASSSYSRYLNDSFLLVSRMNSVIF